VATSHLIEELVARARGPSVLLSGFQHGRHWAVERDRYLELAGASEVIAVFVGREPPPAWDVRHVGVRLRDGDPLTQEWFVLALGPEVAVTLCGLDATPAGDPAEEVERGFETIWSFDPEVARSAAEVVLAGIARSAPEPVAEVRAALVAASGEPLTAQVVSRGADSVLAGLQDRVERLRARERKVERRANEAKTEFLSRMSHELRTPLNAMLGFAQLLGVADVVTEAVALLRPLAAQREIALAEPELAPELHVVADRQRLAQVLINLLSNAVRYTPSGGSVAVVADREAARVRIAVRDTGPGIAAEDLERLFVPFERLERDAATEGTGLGLALSHRLVLAMGGRLEVDSGRGRGSTFTVVLPAAAPPGTPAEARPSTAAPAVPAARCIVYIEDNASNRALVERFFAREGATELRAVASAAEGGALVRAHRPDLVLLDLHLPDRPGEELLAELRGDPATAGIPVIVISADATPGHVERLRRAGVAAYLTKPIDLGLLADAVQRVLA